MKRKYIFLILVIFLISLFLLIINSYYNTSANKIYNEVSSLLDEAMSTGEISYKESLEYYDQAQKNLELILSRYSLSRIAKEISENKMKVGPYYLKELNEEIFPNIKLKAWGEVDPLACAFIIAGSIKEYEPEFSLKAKIQGDITIAYIMSGKFEDADDFLEIIDFKNDSDKSEVMGEFASALSNQKRFEESIKIASSIEYQYFREKALFERSLVVI